MFLLCRSIWNKCLLHKHSSLAVSFFLLQNLTRRLVQTFVFCDKLAKLVQRIEHLFRQESFLLLLPLFRLWLDSGSFRLLEVLLLLHLLHWHTPDALITSASLSSAFCSLVRVESDRRLDIERLCIVRFRYSCRSPSTLKKVFLSIVSLLLALLFGEHRLLVLLHWGLFRYLHASSECHSWFANHTTIWGKRRRARYFEPSLDRHPGSSRPRQDSLCNPVVQYPSSMHNPDTRVLFLRVLIDCSKVATVFFINSLSCSLR